MNPPESEERIIRTARLNRVEHGPRVFSSEDMKEGIQSFVERRSAVFRGK
jgi:hypothetical protein